MYYPLNKITRDLYTSGNEFTVATTLKSYTGAYYASFDGKYFTGAQPGANAVELIRSAGMVNSIPIIQTACPVATDFQFRAGFINRYFTRRVNGAMNSIQEITEQSYHQLQKNPLYLSIALTWGVTDNLSNQDIHAATNKINKLRVSEAEKKLPGIRYLLTNFTELSK